VRQQVCVKGEVCPLPDHEIINILGVKMANLEMVVQKVAIEVEMLAKTLDLDKLSAAA